MRRALAVALVVALLAVGQQFRTTTIVPAADTTIAIAAVIGLVDELAARSKKGLGYLPNRAVRVNASGDLDAVAGGMSDCVRVDGTATPCGSGGGGGEGGPSFVDHAVPGGTVDGSNATFTLPSTPSPAGSLHLYVNGILQRAGSDFTLSGATVTFLSGAIPQAGDALAASYRL